ncbi:MAG: hypothetical protein V2I62_09385 [Bacteroidales bacterium]|jgi:hypothetical protein|nr:hypothetical protein [Bacteroidales bacterium]
MKTQHFVLALLIVLFTFSACREISVTTKVNEDGSFTRIITITGDSADLFKKDLPYPIDDSWLIELKRDSIDSSLYVTYTKTYTNSDLLNKEMRTDTGWMRQLDRTIEVNKRFGFFYSYLRFDEVIKATNPFTSLDFNKFLSPEDLQWLNNEKLPKTTADSTIANEVGEKALEFLAKSITEEITQILEGGLNKLKDPSVNPKIVRIYQDSILTKVNEWEFDSPEIFIDYLSEWTGNQHILNLKTEAPGLFVEFNLKVQFFDKVFELEDYEQFVEMPGLITETNSLALKGNSVSWKVNNLAFMFCDYQMHVESRIVNYWMFVLTGLLVFLLIIFLLIKTFK